MSLGKSTLQLNQQLVYAFGGEPENIGEFVCNVRESLENLVGKFEKERISGSLDQEKKHRAAWG